MSRTSVGTPRRDPRSGGTNDENLADGWRIWDAAVEEDRRQWRALWASSPMQHPFAHPDFCQLLGSGEDRLFAASSTVGHGHILYPFFLRSIEEPVGPEMSAPAAGVGAMHDITSPYGYGGPLHWGLDDVDGAAKQFWASFDNWAENHAVVSEFIRFSLFDSEVLPYPGLVRERQTNFVRDLEASPDEMWLGAGFKKVRKNTRKALREGVSIVIDEDGEHLDEFLDIYLGTMERRSSTEWYRFDRAFFESLHASLPGRFVYVFARRAATMISADLLVLGSDTGYDFLGGTTEQAFSVRPNDLVKVAAMTWLQEHGYRRFVIGGGLSSGDSLERFKRGFAPEGALPFRTGERIISPTDYEALVDRRRRQFERGGSTWASTDEYFPEYRRIPIPVGLRPHSGIGG